MTSSVGFVQSAEGWSCLLIDVIQFCVVLVGLGKRRGGAGNKQAEQGGGGRRLRKGETESERFLFFSSNEGRKNAYFGSVHAFLTLFFSRVPPRAVRVAPGGVLEG